MWPCLVLEIFMVVGGSSGNGDGGVCICIHVCAGTCGNQCSTLDAIHYTPFIFSVVRTSGLHPATRLA